MSAVTDSSLISRMSRISIVFSIPLFLLTACVSNLADDGANPISKGSRTIDPARLAEIRVSFEKLKKPVGFKYDMSTTARSMNPFAGLHPPRLLKVKLNGEALSFARSDEKAMLLLALWPYLNSQFDADAYLIMFSVSGYTITRGQNTLPSEVPYHPEFSNKFWKESGDHLKRSLRAFCGEIIRASGFVLPEDPYNPLRNLEPTTRPDRN